MKKTIYISALGALMLVGATSCIEETLPKNGYMTAEQIQERSDAVDGFVSAITGSPVTSHVYSSSVYTDHGYPGLGMMRDVECEDFPVYSNNHDYFSYYSNNTYLGEYSTADWPWRLYYKYIGNCNNVLRLEENAETARQFGIAHFYRAFFYFDLGRMYEYKDTGYETLDNFAKSYDIEGLTVPIVKENTTEEEARNTPRAPFYELYSFILSDLADAERLLEGTARVSKTHPDLAAIKGMYARFYLELGTRYEQKPEDIDKVKAAGVDLGAANATEAFHKAAQYAREAIARSGAPMDRQTWLTTGFNDINTAAWMLGLSMNKEIISEDSWDGWIAFMSPETLYGIAGMSEVDGKITNQYGCQRMISTDLWSKIPASDWRRQTWVAPEDAGNPAAKAKYSTQVSEEFFAQIPSLAGLKFKPRNYEMVDYGTGSSVDYPLMRVEEMYFILAEATGAADGYGAGASVLSDFLNAYRYTDGSYTCDVYSLSDFRRELMVQKRIEFWGEGLMAWDYKRLNLQVKRKYDGSNFTEQYQLNTKPGYCAPWLNMYIMHSEIGMNTALKPNPDPSTIKL